MDKSSLDVLFKRSVKEKKRMSDLVKVAAIFLLAVAGIFILLKLVGVIFTLLKSAVIIILMAVVAYWCYKKLVSGQ